MTLSTAYYCGGLPAWHQSSAPSEPGVHEVNGAPHASPGECQGRHQPPSRKSNDNWVRTLELGQTVGFALNQAKRLYDGNKKRPSLRRFAHESGVSVSSIWRAYRCHLLAELYPELWYYQALGVAHVAQVLTLSDPIRIALLRRAERRCWSRRQMAAAVAALKAAPPSEAQLHREFAVELSLGARTPRQTEG